MGNPQSKRYSNYTMCVFFQWYLMFCFSFFLINNMIFTASMFLAFLAFVREKKNGLKMFKREKK